MPSLIWTLRPEPWKPSRFAAKDGFVADLEGCGAGGAGDGEGVVDGGGAVFLDEEGVSVVGGVGDGDGCAVLLRWHRE